MAKNTFTAKINDKEVEFKVINITNEIRSESQKFYAKAFNLALENKIMLRVEVEKMLESKGLLDTTADEVKVTELQKKIKSAEVQLRKGILNGKRMSKEDGKALALSIRADRIKLNNIGSGLSKYFSNTVESVADNERLQYFIYACTVNADSGTRFWDSFDLFKTDNINVDVATKAADTFMSSILGLDVNIDQIYYENRWLIKMGFMNSKLQIINAQGQLTDDEGRLIDENGYFIDATGKRVDIYGNRVDDSGNLIEDSWDVPNADLKNEVKVPETPVTMEVTSSST